MPKNACWAQRSACDNRRGLAGALAKRCTYAGWKFVTTHYHTRFLGGLNVTSGGQIFLKWEQLALLGMRGRNRAALFIPPPIWLDIDNAGGARSALVSPESIDTPPQTIILVDEHGSSNIRAFGGMRAVSTGLVCGEKHASGDNVTTTAKYRTLYRLMECSLSILFAQTCPAILPCMRCNAVSHFTSGYDLTHQNKRLDCSCSNRPGKRPN